MTEIIDINLGSKWQHPAVNLHPNTRLEQAARSLRFRAQISLHDLNNYQRLLWWAISPDSSMYPDDYCILKCNFRQRLHTMCLNNSQSYVIEMSL